LEVPASITEKKSHEETLVRSGGFFSSSSAELLTLTTDWNNYNEELFGKPRVDKFGGRLCILRGAVTLNSTSTGDLVCCTILPENYRPSVQLCFGMVVVHPTGEIFCHPQPNEFVSLCGVSFVSFTPSTKCNQTPLKRKGCDLQFKV
jgi:hypothetical protein